MSLLITGSGTIGCQVARSAVEVGIKEVVVFELRPNNKFIESIAGNNVKIEQGSVLNLTRLIEVVQKYNVKKIIHLAVLPEKCPSILDSINTNILGTTNVFEVSRLFGIERVINISSAGIYDFTQRRPKAPVDETWPINDKNIPYLTTKITTDMIAKNYAYKHNLDVITFRLAGTYGPSPDYNMDGKLWISNIIKEAYVNRKIEFDKVPARRLCWTYAKDVGDCLVKAAYFDKKPNNLLYHCMYPKLNGLVEWIEALKELIPDIQIQINEIDERGWKYPYDVSKAIEEFGFEFKYSPKEAFSDFIEWIENNPQFVSGL